MLHCILGICPFVLSMTTSSSSETLFLGCILQYLKNLAARRVCNLIWSLECPQNGEFTNKCTCYSILLYCVHVTVYRYIVHPQTTVILGTCQGSCLRIGFCLLVSCQYILFTISFSVQTFCWTAILKQRWLTLVWQNR